MATSPASPPETRPLSPSGAAPTAIRVRQGFQPVPPRLGFKPVPPRLGFKPVTPLGDEPGECWIDKWIDEMYIDVE